MPAAVRAKAHAERAKHRILVVDDDSLVLSNTTAMLEDLGHTVVEASSGDRALDILTSQVAVDLVITDHAMPHMTGLQLIEEIKDNWPNLPVILATGFAELPPGVSWPPGLELSWGG